MRKRRIGLSWNVGVVAAGLVAGAAVAPRVAAASALLAVALRFGGLKRIAAVTALCSLAAGALVFR